MYVPSNTPKYICYKCRNKICVVDLDGVFHEQLKNFFLSPTEIIKYVEEADKTIKGKVDLLKSLEQERQKIQKEMDKTYHLYIEDKITADGFGHKYRPLEERVKQLENQIPELQGEIDFLKIQYLSKDQILSDAKDLYSRWPELLFEEKRRVVENITEKIVIGKDDITINLCYFPSSSEIMANKPRSFRDSLLPPDWSIMESSFNESQRSFGYRNPERHLYTEEHIQA